jgi:4-amino-4-deoxy-L-arabinose transferase-like glycosyltransferase
VHTPAATVAAAEPGSLEAPASGARSHAVAWGLAGLIALGAAVRFADLGLQSYHHDEVITVMRVIPGSFGHMLHEVKASESNPPLYYALAWAWAKVFGTGEVGLRSLSALLGLLTVPVGYLIGRQLSGRGAGLVLAAVVAVNPMLIWYSQEARSYSLLVLFCGLSLLFFLRALDRGRGRDLGLWALCSALALCSHYFAFFLVALEAVWLLVALRGRLRVVAPAVGAVALAGAALLPLIAAQVDPNHIGWIENSPLPARLVDTGISFLAGETGHVIAEPIRERYALFPAVVIGLVLLLVLIRGSRRERRGAGIGLALGLSVAALAALAALAGKDYVVERNLLPALLPLAATLAVGCSLERARRVGVILAVALCAYWLAFAVYVTRTPNLQRPDFRTLTNDLGPAKGRRAVVSWKLAADPVRWYLEDGAVRWYGGPERIGEVDVVSKPLVAGRPVSLPSSFRRVGRVRLDRLTLTRYVSRQPMRIWFHTLREIPTGFGSPGVVLDGPHDAPPRVPAGVYVGQAEVAR